MSAIDASSLNSFTPLFYYSETPEILQIEDREHGRDLLAVSLHFQRKEENYNYRIFCCGATQTSGRGQSQWDRAWWLDNRWLQWARSRIFFSFTGVNLPWGHTWSHRTCFLSCFWGHKWPLKVRVCRCNCVYIFLPDASYLKVKCCS